MNSHARHEVENVCVCVCVRACVCEELIQMHRLILPLCTCFLSLSNLLSSKYVEKHVYEEGKSIMYRVSTFTRAHTHTHTRTHTHTHPHKQAHKHTRTHTQNTHTATSSHWLLHPRTHTYLLHPSPEWPDPALEY